MKRFKRSLITLPITLVLSGPLFAMSVDYLSIQSSEAARMFSRNAATDAADIISYNPAGTVALKDGAYANLSNQTYSKDWAVESGGVSYKTDQPDWLIPAFYALYKQEDRAYFAAITVPAGGGSVDYKTGLPFYTQIPDVGTYTSGNLKATTYYIGQTVGAAYALNPSVSLALSLRGIYARNTYEGESNYSGPAKLELDAETKAYGVAPILGLFVRPQEGLSVGLRYEHQTVLNFENKTTKDDFGLYPNGKKTRKDLPSLIGLGVESVISADFKMSGSANYYLIKSAKGYHADYDNGYELNLAGQYQLNPSIELSSGLAYADVGGTAKSYSETEYALDYWAIATGGKYNYDENLAFNLGLNASFFQEEKDDTGAYTFNKNTTWGIALGLEHKFM